MKILLTGSSGVIGKELEKLLSDHEVLMIDKVVSDHTLHSPNHHFVQCRIGEQSCPEIGKFDPEVIFHLAASFERTKESADFYEQNWIDNMECFHYVASHTRPKIFVFASSYLVYDIEAIDPEEFKYMGLPETCPINPRNMCGIYKLYAEKELEFIQKNINTKMNIINARIFRSYGKGSRDIVSRWIRSAIKKEPINIYNIANSFDYVYAGDVAKALYLLSHTNKSATVNIGTGNRTSIRTVSSIICNKFNIPYPETTAIKSDIEDTVAVVEKLKNLVNWIPDTTIEQGIDKIIEYERSLR